LSELRSATIVFSRRFSSSNSLSGCTAVWPLQGAERLLLAESRLLDLESSFWLSFSGSSPNYDWLRLFGAGHGRSTSAARTCACADHGEGGRCAAT
jgi:hypothetical protein